MDISPNPDFWNDLANSLSAENSLIEIAIASKGGSKFNRAVYYTQITPEALHSIACRETNISFLSDCNIDKMDVIFGKEIFRQSQNACITAKHIVSFDIDFKDMHEGFKDLALEQRRALLIATAGKIIEQCKTKKIPLWILNSSGNGLHLHFRFSEPIKINAPQDYKQSYLLWLDLLELAFDQKLVFDKACCNPGRIIRLPGSTNWKDAAQPIKTEIFFHNPLADASKFLEICENFRNSKSKTISLETLLKFFKYSKLESLKKVGDQIVCSSPFTHDFSPSFYFHPQKQIYFDFSKGEGGSFFKLVAKLANLDPEKDTVEIRKKLAEIRGESDASTSRFTLRANGVWFSKSIDEDSESLWICSPLVIKAATRNQQSNAWGRILSFPDQDGVQKSWPMPMEMLAGDGLELRRELLNQGLRISTNSKARSYLMEYIQTEESEDRVRCVAQIGWQAESFVLPSAVYCRNKSDEVIALQKEGEFSCFQTRGTLDEWQSNVAVPCTHNSRLIFSLAAAFTPPLLKLVGEESGGIHFVGSSSVGKTLALRIAGSVWGGGGVSGYLRKWRSTVNGLESLAEDRNDCLITLDEISEISARDAAYATYMLANGGGKKRMGRHGEAKESAEWRTLFLSSGEIGLGNHLAESGEKHRGGQFVRLVEIEADVGKNLGIFDEIGDASSASQLADKLRSSCDRFYGTAIHEYLQKLVQVDLETIENIRKDCLKFLTRNSLHGQIGRVAKRFALIATGGILASQMDIIPMSTDEILSAIKNCFNNWSTLHSDHPDFESEKILATIRRYLQVNGCAYFPEWDGRERLNFCV